MENCIFKKLLILIFLIGIITGCKESLKICHLSKGLDTVLSDYIDRHPKDSIIIMQFYGVEGRTILNIQHAPYYPFKDFIDGCFIYKDKLVLYCLLDKSVLVDGLVDSTYTSDKTILNHYKSWDEVDFEYDGNSDSESYLVKSRDNIVKAVKTDLQFHEKVSGTIGIRSNSINDMLNQRINSHNVPITAIRFASFENSDYLMMSEANVYTKESLSGCLKRNGRIITFYKTDKLHNPNLIDMELIQMGLPLLNNYKEIPSDWFDFESSEGDVFKILPNGYLEKVSIEKLSDEKYELLYKALRF